MNRLLIAIALTALALPLALTTPGTSMADADNSYTLPEKSGPKYPNLDSMLNQLVARVEEGEATFREAAEDAPVHHGPSVAVTIYLSGNVDDVALFLEDNGESPRNTGEDYIEAYVPVSLLGAVSEQPGVVKVRAIVPPEAAYGGSTSQGVQAHAAQPWHQAGYGGQGVKVGIIDLSFAELRDLMGEELPATVRARCYTDIGRYTRNLADCERGGSHGTRVAEAVIDTAPDVSLYLANPSSNGDLRATVEWMVSEGVSVINHSIGWTFDGPGNGTSPFRDSPLRAVDRAVDGGAVWVNSAGSAARKTWFSRGLRFEEEFVLFHGSDFTNDMHLKKGDRITAFIRWDDRWGGATRDFDLAVFVTEPLELVARSIDPQQGGADTFPLNT